MSDSHDTCPAPSVYVRVLPGRSLPEGVSLRDARDGVASIELPDGTWACKDRWRSWEELRLLVHAEDAGDVEVLTADEIRCLQDA